MHAALRGLRLTSLSRKKLYLTVLVVASITTMQAQTHQSRWEFTESFIRDTWLHPIRTLDVTIAGEGPVHDPPNDCEIHIGAELADQTIGDFADLVLEPPNVCKDTRRSSRQAWRTFYHTLVNQICSANGFIRAWPEHLEVGQGASNPPHIMELHPLRSLNCQNNVAIDVKQQLAAHADIGYKTGRQIETLLRTFRLWVRRMPHPDDQSLSTIEFDYYSCTFVATKEKCAFGGSVHNFGRLLVRTIGNTKRCSGGGNNGEEFRTIIGRARARGRTGAPVSRAHLTKFYGLPGTNFYDALGGQCSPAGPPTKTSFDVLAIFTVDPLAVLKTVEKISQDNQNGQWVEVPFPVAFIVFDEMP